MIAGAAQFFAALLAKFILLIPLCAGIYAGIFSHRHLAARLPSGAATALAAMIGLTVFLATLMPIGNVSHVLESYSCGSAKDYELCMEGAPEGDPM